MGSSENDQRYLEVRFVRAFRLEERHFKGDEAHRTANGLWTRRFYPNPDEMPEWTYGRVSGVRREGRDEADVNEPGILVHTADGPAKIVGIGTWIVFADGTVYTETPERFAKGYMPFAERRHWEEDEPGSVFPVPL